jgi:DegV family protein with EDD domain
MTPGYGRCRPIACYHVRRDPTVRIVTNPGSDLSPSLLDRYEIDLTPQQIVVDGTPHDTRGGIELGQIDDWVRSAREHPYVLGTSAAEFARVFSELGRTDPQLLAVMTSRKLIQSYDAAVSASNTLARHTKHPLQVRVVDTGVTSVGAGLVTLLAAVAREQGHDLDAVARLSQRFVEGLDMKFCVATMEYLVKGGRASALRAWMADLLRVRPMLAFKKGEIAVAAKISASADLVATLTDAADASMHGRRVWIAVAHGGVPELAERLAHELRRRLDVAFLYVVPFSPAIYLHAGPGSIGYCAGPVDDLGWTPPVPEA